MITIQGTPVRGGTAIAVGAIVTSAAGTNNVWPSLLKKGVDALVRQLPEQDRPAAVMVCDKLEAAHSTRIAGVTLVATIAQEDSESYECEIDGPCVVSLPNLLASVRENDIIIVDGAKGLVVIDPDVQTLLAYQRTQEDFIPRSRIRITADHIGATTLDGVPIAVYALVKTPAELDKALEQGADGLYLSGHDEADYDTFFREAAGKPTLIAYPTNFDALLSAAAEYCVPHQVTALFPEGLEEEEQLLQAAIDFFPMRKPDYSLPPDIRVGRIQASDPDAPRSEAPLGPVAVLAVDCSRDASQIAAAVAEVGGHRVVVICPDDKPDVQALIQTGARSLAVRHDIVRSVKDKVRTVTAERLA
jgi:hypothetical protein